MEIGSIKFKMAPLTKKQKKILDIIVKYIEEQGFSPSYRQIGYEAGLSSPATVWQHIKKLKEKGYIIIDKATHLISLSKKFYQSGPFWTLPLLGEVQAGYPLTMYEQSESIAIPRDLGLSPNRDYFVLKVRGDSMINAGIFEGDYIICEKGALPRNGEVVVARIGEDKMTLKTIFIDPKKKLIRLQPENPRMEPIFVRRTDIQGVVRAMLRKY